MSLFLTKVSSKLQFAYLMGNVGRRIHSHQLHCLEGTGTISGVRLSVSPPKRSREDTQNGFTVLSESV